MISFIRKSKFAKIISVFLAFTLIIDVFTPSNIFALTSGGKQPEFSSFEPIGTSEMVDVFSGDFTYNIPLMDVEGYPINISYHSGISMDQEASWVGLGWNINPGVINRNMRSLPDDFNGDKITKEFNIKKNETYGITVFPDIEWFGLKTKKLLKKLKVGVGFFYNTYNGVGFEVSVNPALKSWERSGVSLNTKISLNSESGLGVSPNICFSKDVKDKNNQERTITGKIGLAFNSRAGLQALTISTSVDKSFTGGSVGNPNKGKPYGFSVNGGSAFSFSAPAYTPHIEMPMSNTCFNISATLGGAAVGAHPGARFQGYYSAQYLSSNTKELSAYGYMYLQNGTDDYAMLDFNREKDGTFTEHTPALPLTNLTYDLYSVSGQGISGMYKPFRGDIGVVFDSKVENQSSGLELPDIEIGAGNVAHPGVNMALNFANSSSGKWSDKNDVANKWAFTGSNPGNMYEPFYFKQAGEKTAENDNFFKNIGEFDPVRIKLAGDGMASAFFDQESIDETTLLPTPSTHTINFNKRTHRARRNENISVMTANEAASHGEITQIESYKMNDFPICTTCTDAYKNRYLPDLSSRKQHGGSHISQIIANRADGARYVYGIPAYNLKQEDVSFAVDATKKTIPSPGLITYDDGTDNSVNNKQGMDHYYEKTTLPEYAHSYLLTEVLSADYVDAKGDGPTPDDLGTYTKINYTAAYDKAKPYHWRVPYEKGMANYNEGLKSLTGEKGDDKANYIYGEKEVWYVHSIETKMYVAEFTLASREDGFGVKESNDKDTKGGINTNNPLQKLMKITLYSRQDKIKEANDNTQKYKATPIKTVHFEYDYSLCPGIPNSSNNGGKLTLTKIYFTYGSSLKGKLSPYVFNYADFNHDKNANPPYGTKNVNYSYDMKGYDRWGNYKPNPQITNPYPPQVETNPLTTSEFPYVEQNDKDLTDQYAAAWSLTSIQLPSGGLINIDYEADDYAFVQDRKAMQMVKIIDANENLLSDDAGLKSVNSTGFLYKDFLDSYEPKNYLYFKLQKSITAASQAIADKYVKEQYLTDENGQLIKNMYFKFLLNLKTETLKNYEFVPGYVEINGIDLLAGKLYCYGAIPTTPGGNTYNYGYVKIKHASISDNSSDDASTGTLLDLNPITYTGFNFTKLYRPRLVYNQVTESNIVKDYKVLSIFSAMFDAFLGAFQSLTGINQSMRVQSFSKEFVPSKSFIRLYNPIASKKGGGLRVKRLAMSDSWESMTNNRTATPSNYRYITAEYGQEYDYTTTDAQGNSISSGVAAYEPLLGGDENPFREPVYFKDENTWVPDEVHSQEKPYGESFFPGANVGYSKVTVRNLQHTNATKHATGKVVHEFYTAKDFPTLTRKTGLFRLFPTTADDFLSAVSPYYVNHTTASQGFVVEVNNMHGIPKSQEVYAEDKGNPISGVRYNYKTKSDKKLDNDFLVMGKKGNIEKAMVGVDYDFVADAREASSDNGSVGLGGNLDAFFAMFPGIVITIFPSASYEQTYFNSITTTKVINRYGILEETVAYDLGSIVRTKNRVLDAETGEVLLSETQNQFDDPVYSFKYPAHWAYQGMGPSYWNTGVVENTNINNGNLMRGDEVNANGAKAWINFNKSANKLEVIDKDGIAILNPYPVKVLRSGSRNQQNTPIGTVTMLKNPLENNNTVFNLSFENVLNTGAVEYSDEWRLFCECGFDPSTTIYNPYVKGTLGNWRAKTSYLFLTDRTQTRMNNNVNIRKDGVFTSFSPFWKLNGAKTAWDKNLTNWTYTSEVTEYSPYGFELENKDALNRHSSAIYGYNNHLPIAVSSNAKYTDIAFDSFEDYDFDDCIDDHFSFEQGGTYVTTTGTAATVTEVKSHAGKRSIMLTPTATITLKKIKKKTCP